MEDLDSTDTRGFHMLPQRPEQVGYYTYGTPGGGAAQFAHPKLLSLLYRIESLWQAQDDRKLGIGNISKARGIKMKDHRSHRSGLDVDVRPLRRDGENMRVTRFDKLYDRVATAELIGLFLDSGEVDVVYFNDLRIRSVKFLIGHDDHFHVTVRKPEAA
jgi:penicillin-insensitive murein endopeptidase